MHRTRGTRETPRPEDVATSPCLTLRSSLFAINKNSCGLLPCLLPSSPLSSLPLRAEDKSAFSFTSSLTPCHSFLPPSNMLGSHFYHITRRFVLGAQFYIFLPGGLEFPQDRDLIEPLDIFPISYVRQAAPASPLLSNHRENNECLWSVFLRAWVSVAAGTLQFLEERRKLCSERSCGSPHITQLLRSGGRA